jgi:cell division protein ZapE
VAVTDFASVSMRLSGEIAAGRLEFDAGQRDAAARLDRLSASIGEDSLVDKLGTRFPLLPKIARATSPKSPQRGVYLWGGVGRGKTLLMDWFYDSLRTERRERSHFYRFMRQVHTELRNIAGSEEPLEILAQRLAERARVICLDEFLVADIADAMILGGLIEGLFRRGVTLVATSNTPPVDLYKDGLQRQRFLPAIELLQTHMDVVHLDGAIDYRLRRLEQAPTYLDSTLTGSAAQLQQSFAALAGATAAGPTVLTIEERPLAALAVGAGIVWFEFAELCAGPRSQNDYIEIARMYPTVFVSNIPEFTHDDDNTARRFIMLIDEFYDRSVKLVVSAAAPPAALYRGDRLTAEFERTSSRLVEMQTQHYLAGEHRP